MDKDESTKRKKFWKIFDCSVAIILAFICIWILVVEVPKNRDVISPATRMEITITQGDYIENIEVTDKANMDRMNEIMKAMQLEALMNMKETDDEFKTVEINIYREKDILTYRRYKKLKESVKALEEIKSIDK